jgi:hypothetical protein
MKRAFLIFVFLIPGWLGILPDSRAEQWITLPGHMDRAYYDTDSIQFPYRDVYDLGLFSIERVDKDVMRVWTQLYLKDSEAPRILYEIKFSDRLYKTVYTVDQLGRPLDVIDTAYKPIIPGSLENDLFEMVGREPVREKNSFSGMGIND